MTRGKAPRGGGSSQRGGAVKVRQSVKVVPGENILPGRHPCSCQARLHSLIRNCMSCGKIVCKQEGSGPCFFCGELVCTREQRETLERNSKKSAELYKELTGKEMPKGGINGISLEEVGSKMKNAVEFRNTLLEADAHSERRTAVNDLESDFANVSSNQFLTKEERDAIIRRRDELRSIREKRRKTMAVDIDLSTRTVVEKRQNLAETDVAYDPVIQQILSRSDARRKDSDLAAAADAKDGRWRPIGYVPKYAGGGTSCAAQRAAIEDEHDEMCIGRQSAEAAALEVERRGFALAVPQPFATFLAHGYMKCVRWDEDPMMTGPMFICSTSSTCDKDTIEAAIKQHKVSESASSLDYSSGAVLGRGYMSEVLTLREFESELSIPLSSVPGDGNYVLMFSSHEPLLSSVPHVPPSTGQIYQLDPALKSALSHVFSG